MITTKDKYAAMAQDILDSLWVSTFGVVSMDTSNKELVAKALERAALEAAANAYDAASQIVTEDPFWEMQEEARKLRTRLAELDKEAKE